MGGKHIKTDEFYVYFDILRHSDIDDEKKLLRAKHAFNKTFGLGLKIRRKDK